MREIVLLTHNDFYPPTFDEGGAYCFTQLHVGWFVLQLVTQQRFAPVASNLVGR